MSLAQDLVTVRVNDSQVRHLTNSRAYHIYGQIRTDHAACTHQANIPCPYIHTLITLHICRPGVQPENLTHCIFEILVRNTRPTHVKSTNSRSCFDSLAPSVLPSQAFRYAGVAWAASILFWMIKVVVFANDQLYDAAVLASSPLPPSWSALGNHLLRLCLNNPGPSFSVSMGLVTNSLNGCVPTVSPPLPKPRHSFIRLTSITEYEYRQTLLHFQEGSPKITVMLLPGK